MSDVKLPTDITLSDVNILKGRINLFDHRSQFSTDGLATKGEMDDIMMADVGLDKHEPTNRPPNHNNSDNVWRPKVGVSKQKSSSAQQIYQQTFSTDVNKLKAIDEFDNPVDDEHSKA